MTKPHLFIHVQHLLGIGHMERAFAIASACSDVGFEVTVATGKGSCTSGSRYHWAPLPDLRSADAAFSTLVDDRGEEVTAAFWTRRTEALLKGFRETDPDLLLIEGFPFARRRFRHELLPLLTAARAKEIPILCSIRDILQPKSDKARIAESRDWANEYFDLILVHGDPNFATLADSYSGADTLETPIAYTGYVAKPIGPDDGATGHDEVIVSAGGGAVGETLFKTALAAAALPGADRWHWRFLVGRNMQAEAESTSAPPNVTIEPAREDFRALLSRAAVSVSQCGYNTAVDLFCHNTPAVLVPFADGGQKEQAIRAEKMAALSDAVVLTEDGLTAEDLLAAVERQSKGRSTDAPALDMAGAERTARILSLCLTRGAADAAELGLQKTERTAL